MINVDIRQFSVTATIKQRMDNEEWTVTAVYGPQTDADKLFFLQELRQLRQSATTRWIVLGDFNLIYRSSDKNNCRVNRRLMNSFRSALDELEVRELHLHGRKFTWSSGTASPTMTKIDMSS
jgi:hypothetical protein